MSSTASSSGSNVAPTGPATERTRKLIASCEKTLGSLNTHIKEEKDRLVVCNTAISNLELAIPETKEALKAHKEILSALKQIQSRLPTIESVGSLALKRESLSESLYRRAIETATGPVSRLKRAIDPEAEALEDEVRKLLDNVREMELELEGWRVSRQSSTQLLKDIVESKKLIENNLKTAKEVFRPIWRMPPNAWAAIFKYTIDDALSTYLVSNNNYGFIHPIYVVSQVCHHWRFVTQNEPNLWESVYVSCADNWTQPEYDRVADFRMRSNRPITVVTNIYQYFYGGWRGQRYDRNGGYINVTAPNERTLFEGKPYDLLVDMQDDNYQYMQRMSYLPLRNPSSLTLSVRNSNFQGYFFNYLSNYTGVKSLTIQNDTPSWLHHDSIGSLFPHLTTLKIFVNRLPGFQLIGFLPATLEELHLRHDDDSSLPQLSQDVTLPKLHTLGISSLGSYLLDRLTAHALRNLTLYGPATIRQYTISATEKSADSFRRVQQLRLQDWKRPNGDDLSVGGVAVFRELTSKMKILRSVALDHCWVEGHGLVSVLENVLGQVGEGQMKKLEDITLNHPTGITRDQCEALQKLVKKLNVYV